MSTSTISPFNISLLWFGTAISIAEIMTGTLLAPLGMTYGFCAILLGHLIGGIILFLTIEGNGNKYGFRGGATVIDMINIFKRYGAYNAANLDGGASSVLAINGKVYNHPVAYSATGERSLPNAWIVK